MNDRIHAILEKYWGYSSFRPLQKEIIQSVLSGVDTLGLLPTGGGKSLTFQVPAMLLDGITIVVTPLISLMKDQVDNLRAKGIKALYLHSGLSRRENKLAIDRCMLGRVKLLYVSPEKLQSPVFIGQLKDMSVSLIVVDESHCISQWGYDFRPSYLKISELRKIFPSVPVLALTASATPEVVADIKAKLGFGDVSKMFAKSFYRDNISYIVRFGDNKPERLVKILKNTRGSAIVYVRSRKRTREIAQLLVENGISADYYHAGLAIEDKDSKQQKWKNDECRVIVATNAFGMGIDKPDVRVVVHMDIPASLEEYYQEAGRVGRDGKPSFAVILAAMRDKAILRRRVSENFPDKEFIIKVYELACNFMNVAVGAGYNQVYDFNLALFCTRFKLPVLLTRSALRLLSQSGYFEYEEDVDARARLIMLAGRDELYGFRGSENADAVLQHILRSYSGIFADYVNISETSIAYRLQISENDVYQALLELNRAHILHYIPRRTEPYIFFTTSRELPKHVLLPISVYEEMRDRMSVRINAMEQFVFDDSQCRSVTMLHYFGEHTDTECGMCDVCRTKRGQRTDADNEEILQKSIIYLASKPDGCHLNKLLTDAPAKPTAILDMVRRMLDNGQLIINEQSVIKATNQ